MREKVREVHFPFSSSRVLRSLFSRVPSPSSSSLLLVMAFCFLSKQRPPHPFAYYTLSLSHTHTHSSGPRNTTQYSRTRINCSQEISGQLRKFPGNRFHVCTQGKPGNISPTCPDYPGPTVCEIRESDSSSGGEGRGRGHKKRRASERKSRVWKKVKLFYCDLCGHALSVTQRVDNDNVDSTKEISVKLFFLSLFLLLLFGVSVRCARADSLSLKALCRHHD